MKKESPPPPPPPPPPQEVNHQPQAATGSQVETGSYFETLIHRGKLHVTAIPLEGWKIDHLQIYPPGLKAILKEFQHEYLVCPTDPEDWKKIEERFRNRWNVPHACGALDGKHIAIKKPKKSGSEYFNYKGYFSLVLLALVDADYKFQWVNAGASGSSSDAQIFIRSKLKRRIENGTLGLPPPEPLGPGGPDLHYFLLGDDAFALMPWLVKPYSRRQLTREERIAN